MLNIKEFAHACVMTHDLVAAEHFYCHILGLKKVFDFTKNGEKCGLYLQVGARQFVEVFTNDASPIAKAGQVDHICFAVDNLDEAVAKLKHHGIAVTAKKYGVDDTWQAWLADPSGSRIELFQYTEKSAQFLGGNREIDW